MKALLVMLKYEAREGRAKDAVDLQAGHVWWWQAMCVHTQDAGLHASIDSPSCVLGAR